MQRQVGQYSGVNAQVEEDVEIHVVKNSSRWYHSWTHETFSLSIAHREYCLRFSALTAEPHRSFRVSLSKTSVKKRVKGKRTSPAQGGAVPAPGEAAW
jgi:hypothetical protein